MVTAVMRIFATACAVWKSQSLAAGLSADAGLAGAVVAWIA
jgi:hypothetical protein